MSDVETIERQAREIRARDAEIERLRSALHDAEAIGDFPSELRDRLSLKENAAAFEKMANEAIAIGQTFLAQRDERDAEIADMKSWVERRDEEIARWKGLHEQSEWRGAAYVEALREIVASARALANLFVVPPTLASAEAYCRACGGRWKSEATEQHIFENCTVLNVRRALAKIETVLSPGGAAPKETSDG